MIIFFFFSSRRRHTSFSRDWSSDVCSSDLASERSRTVPTNTQVPPAPGSPTDARSEERRVGKECRSRGSPYHEKKKNNKYECRGEDGLGVAFFMVVVVMLVGY